MTAESPLSLVFCFLPLQLGTTVPSQSSLQTLKALPATLGNIGVSQFCPRIPFHPFPSFLASTLALANPTVSPGPTSHSGLSTAVSSSIPLSSYLDPISPGQLHLEVTWVPQIPKSPNSLSSSHSILVRSEDGRPSLPVAGLRMGGHPCQWHHHLPSPVDSHSMHLYKGIGTGRHVCPCSIISLMFDSLRHYGLQPARLHSPWDSPGRNTGDSCHGHLRGSSRPRDRTCISCIAGRFFTN